MMEHPNRWGEGSGPKQQSVPLGQDLSAFVPPGHYRASDGRVYPVRPPPPPGFFRASDGNDYPVRPLPVGVPLDRIAARKVERLQKKRKDPGLGLMTLIVVAGIAAALALSVVWPGAAFGGWYALGAYTQYLAQRRGRIKTWPWFVYGMLLGPFAILHAALLRPTPEQLQEQAKSKWATDDLGLCHFVDGYASGPCLKRKDHVVLGLKKSPHDWRETARGQF